MRLFHMPLLVCASGFFAKSTVKNGCFRAELIASIVALAISFQLVLITIEHHGGPITKTPLSFESAPWYLIALAVWYLLTPLFS